MMDASAKRTHDIKSGQISPSSISPLLKPLNKYKGTILVKMFMMAVLWAYFSWSFAVDLFWSISQAVQSVGFWFFTFWRCVHRCRWVLKG